jgi:mRNA interferase RelE/StbE
METRVSIKWTETAKEGLKKLPPKVRRGILNKVDELYGTDPRHAHKALVGPLQGYYSLRYSRYRAIYSADAEQIANGDLLIHVNVRFVIVGIRTERDKKDVYKIAQKLIELGLIDVHDTELDADEDDSES